MRKVKPVVTKKYVFARRLDGKPIVLDFFDNDMRAEKWAVTRELLFDLRVHEYLPNDPDYAWLNNHEIHCILPRDKQPYTMVIRKGTKFDENNHGSHKNDLVDENTN